MAAVVAAADSLFHSALARSRKAAGFSGGKLLVGLSGGKDSLATLDICQRSGAFDQLEAFSMYLIRGLECFEAPIEAAAKRHGIQVHYVPHWDVARMLKFGILSFHQPNTAGLREQRLRDVEAALVGQTGIEWFAYGDRATDSISRRIYTRDSNGVHEKWRRLWPIWDWRDEHVYKYLDTRRIPHPKRIGKRRMSGVSLMPAELLHISQHYPADYARLKRVFSFCDVQVEKARRAAEAHALPVVLDGASESSEPVGGAVQPAQDRRAESEEASA